MGELMMLRLASVMGAAAKVNDIIFCSSNPDNQEDVAGNVIFFGGDVQDYPEKMLAHRDNCRQYRWNLEATAQILSNRFPNHHVWVVKPAKMMFSIFSVYANFVESNDTGCPQHSVGQDSWLHLQRLLENAVLLMEEKVGGSVHDSAVPDDNQDQKRESMQGSTIEGENQDQHRGPTCSSGFDETCQSEPIEHAAAKFSASLPVVLVGFSKGCVVLNQLLYDLQEARDDADRQDLVSRVQTMYWLDGGHNGGSKTWVTEEQVLKGLVGANICVKAFMTPYQMQDQSRAWISKEQKRFVHILKRLGVQVESTKCFQDEERSLENHFRVLTVF